MSALKVAAYAKVNLGLFITGQRPDGYHLLDMVMQSVSLCDWLLLEKAEEITLQGDTAGAAGMDNLAMRAACLLAHESGVKVGCRITLKKYIPAQAGLGGGSADAAAVLLGLNRLWKLQARPAELAALALKLGADVPFFLQGGTARARGIGEQLTPAPHFPRLELVIVKPEQGLSTPAVFRAWHHGGRLQPSRIEAYLAAMAAGDYPLAGRLMGNDLEAPASALCPGIGQALEAQRRSGALQAMMTGSGTAVLGWYADSSAAARAAAALQCAGWRAWHVHSRKRAIEIYDGIHA